MFVSIHFGNAHFGRCDDIVSILLEHFVTLVEVFKVDSHVRFILFVEITQEARKRQSIFIHQAFNSYQSAFVTVHELEKLTITKRAHIRYLEGSAP